MSENLPQKVWPQLTLAYAFGIIGVLSSAYVYWDEKKNIKDIKENYSNNLVVDSLTIKKGSGLAGTKIDNYGIQIEGLSSNIYIGGGEINIGSHSKDSNGKPLSSFTHMTPYGFSANLGEDGSVVKINPVFISLEKKMYSGETSIASIGTVSYINSLALGFTSSIEEKNKDGSSVVKQGTSISPSDVSVYDENHTRVSMGVQTLSNSNTGSVETTSPSTIVLFDKDGNLIYRVPHY